MVEDDEVVASLCTGKDLEVSAAWDPFFHTAWFNQSRIQNKRINIRKTSEGVFLELFESID